MLNKSIAAVGLYILCSASLPRQSANVVPSANAPADTILLADPTIFYEKGEYYLYGTGDPNGFKVYKSADMKHWGEAVGRADGYAMRKGDSYGNGGFWAPQIFKHHGKYYMAYVADEQVAIAESDSPLGPFKQQKLGYLSGPGKQIDPYIFKDTDGKLYLYYVRLQKGNRIFVARLKDDLSDIDNTTARECISGEEYWENTANSDWPVTEGPTVIKRQGLYYLFYSANDFRNIDYAVGYATSTSPTGPWKRYTGNPIISRKLTGYNGSGHGDFFNDKTGLHYVFHTHFTNSKVSPRKTAIVSAKFSADKPAVLKVDSSSFRFLVK